MEQYAGFNVHFDELVHADTIAMRKATFEKLSGAKVVDYSPPVESLLSQERVTELRDKQAEIPVHDATDLGVFKPSDTEGGEYPGPPAPELTDEQLLALDQEHKEG